MSFDPVFYRKIYPDLRFIPTKQELYSHWVHSGMNEGRLSSESQLREFVSDLPYKFDLKTYQQYPDVPNNELDCLVHFYMHGYKENRTYSQSQLQDTNHLLEEQLYDEITSNDHEIVIEDELKKINILIRTHAREEMFVNCISSVLNQTYKNFHVYVHVQNDKDLNYVNRSINTSEKVTIIRSVDTTAHHNTFCNDLIQCVSDGWLMFLDDDDQFTTNNALALISPELDKNKIVLWKYKRPDMLVFPDITHDLTNPGTIASTTYCIHHQIASMSTWPAERQGDFHFIKPIFNTLERIMLDNILTKYQLQNQVASFGKSTTSGLEIPTGCQLHTSDSLKHLHERFIKKYKLTQLTDSHAPCIFFGFYHPRDFELFHNHQGPKFAMFGGSDCDLRIPGGMNNILLIAQNLKQTDSIVHISDDIEKRIIETGNTSQGFGLNLVDYDLFKPVDQPGECVFIYNGMNGMGNKKIYGEKYYNKIIELLPQYKYIRSNDLHLPYEKMPDIYSQCFIGLRLTDQDGNANMVQEFEAMGIPVVHNNSEYGLKWSDVDSIVSHIEENSNLRF